MSRLTDLIDGYRRFRDNEWHKERDRWAELAEGQSPRVMVIACSDSRVDPGQIFDTRPGEIFVVRNVANLAPPYEMTGGLHGVSAALEFAVTQLEVDEILVMGHGSCGGCAAALTGHFDGADDGAGHFIAAWVKQLDPARERVLRRHQEATPQAMLDMEWESVKLSLANLRTFPWIREREQDGRLALHGGHFSVAQGKFYVLDEAEGEFRPVS